MLERSEDALALMLKAHAWKESWRTKCVKEMTVKRVVKGDAVRRAYYKSGKYFDV